MLQSVYSMMSFPFFECDAANEKHPIGLNGKASLPKRHIGGHMAKDSVRVSETLSFMVIGRVRRTTNLSMVRTMHKSTSILCHPCFGLE